MKLSSLLLSCLITLVVRSHGLETRVEVANGVPRLVLDGKPVPPRMFYGGFGLPSVKSEEVGSEWRQIEFDFTAHGSTRDGMVSLRIRPQEGEFWIEDFEVTAADRSAPALTGSEDSFQIQYEGPVPPGMPPVLMEASAIRCHLRLHESGESPTPPWRLERPLQQQLQAGERYHVSLRAKSSNLHRLAVEFHESSTPYFLVGGYPVPFLDEVKLAAQAGVHFLSFPVYVPWPKLGEPYDFDLTDSMTRAILEANPKALLIPRVNLNPPPWWAREYPDHVMQWENGHRSHMVVSSPVYLRYASEWLSRFIRHMEENYGEHMAGYHPVGQNTDEWFYEGSWDPPLNGYALADRDGFRAWLTTEYHTDSALQAAWHNPAVTLATADVPAPERRHLAPRNVLRDPQAPGEADAMSLIDWGRYQQDAMANCVVTLARVARAASAGRKLILFFYGYVHELSSPANGPYVSGHFRLRKVLDSPDIDILCAPLSYHDRGLGGGGPVMTAAESVALAGKMWLNEDDTRTHRSNDNFPAVPGNPTASLKETNNIHTRNLAQQALRHFGTWWMDLLETGWLNEAGIWDPMRNLAALDTALLDSPTAYAPEIAVVVDEEALAHVGAGWRPLMAAALSEVRGALNRVGAPYGQYLMDDVWAGRVQAKLYVFLNPWNLTESQRTRLHEVTQGSIRLLCLPFAPAGQGTAELSPFRLLPVPGPAAWAIPARSDFTTAFGLLKPDSPPRLFCIDDATVEETLARFPDGSVAAAWRSPFLVVTAPGLSTEIVRFAAREAGVHLFTDTDCNVYANGPFLALHAAHEGVIELNTGSEAPVIDFLSGKNLGQGPMISLPVHLGDTRILKIR